MFEKIEAGLSHRLAQLQCQSAAIVAKIRSQLDDAAIEALLSAEPMDRQSAQWTAQVLWYVLAEMVTALETGTVIPNKEWILRFMELHQKYVELSNQLQLSNLTITGPTSAEASEQLKLVLEDPVVKFVLDSADFRSTFQFQAEMSGGCDPARSSAAPLPNWKRRRQQRRSLPAFRSTSTARHPRRSLPSTASTRVVDVGGEQRGPMLRFEQMSAGLAWDYPLSRTEKRELLMLHMAEGERAALVEQRKSQALYVEMEHMMQQQQQQKHPRKRSLSSRNQRVLGLVRKQH
eukprot:gnl/MRDRNA2_/MRDRNA2_33775_c0_seq1.p1 gnl/MRDRNA2_/MRDRNA2_33775_c0~~gnl/MRDRNA2_/MRDRNA2_33775_c0_seq1.p1  ORF type:complete len:302 (-),score=72.30 gnl/MRDRNA2_/MRDRNA2_33775_c0_seq1:112-981(-)